MFSLLRVLSLTRNVRSFLCAPLLQNVCQRAPYLGYHEWKRSDNQMYGARVPRALPLEWCRAACQRRPIESLPNSEPRRPHWKKQATQVVLYGRLRVNHSSTKVLLQERNAMYNLWSPYLFQVRAAMASGRTLSKCACSRSNPVTLLTRCRVY